MDDADRADERIQHAIADGIAKAHRAMELRATGFCYYCNAPVAPSRVFCSVECRDDWDWEQDRRKVNGDV